MGSQAPAFSLAFPTRGVCVAFLFPDMETESDADAPLPATPDEPADEAPPEADAELPAGDEALGFAQELADLAATAEGGRLNAAQEERGTELLKQALQSGRAGVAVAVATLPRLPWLVGIRAVETVWPELTAGFRTQLLAGLAKDETDAARRMRLSLARRPPPRGRHRQPADRRPRPRHVIDVVRDRYGIPAVSGV